MIKEKSLDKERGSQQKEMRWYLTNGKASILLKVHPLVKISALDQSRCSYKWNDGSTTLKTSTAEAKSRL